jgi:hypothetical protein
MLVPTGTSLVFYKHVEFLSDFLTSVACISSASAAEIELGGFRETSLTLFSKFICRMYKLWAVAFYDEY